MVITNNMTMITMETLIIVMLITMETMITMMKIPLKDHDTHGDDRHPFEGHDHNC